MRTRGILLDQSAKTGRANLLWSVFFAALFLLTGSGLVLGKVLDNKLTQEQIEVANEPVEELRLPTPSATPASFNIPSTFELKSAVWVPQTYNNCGPAAASMVLQYFGIQVSQAETKAALRTSSDDKNVYLSEISTYLDKTHGIKSRIFVGGTLERAKLLISQGFYLVVEDWLHPNEDIGHVLILRGYDDARGVFIADDSYFGVGITYPYESFADSQWKPFNYEYMPVYLPEKEELLKTLVGEDWDQTKMHTNAIQLSETQIKSNENDMYAWFNLGTSAFALGDYQKAGRAFDRAREIGWPRRMLWYQIQPVETYNKLGQYRKALDLALEGLWENSDSVELQAQADFAREHLSE